jgi:TPR repeat protein
LHLQARLGGAYRTGEGVTKNLAKAMKYTQLAADQGNSEADYNIGMMYYTGEGMEKNLVGAKRHDVLVFWTGIVCSRCAFLSHARTRSLEGNMRVIQYHASRVFR